MKRFIYLVVIAILIFSCQKLDDQVNQNSSVENNLGTQSTSLSNQINFSGLDWTISNGWSSPGGELFRLTNVKPANNKLILKLNKGGKDPITGQETSNWYSAEVISNQSVGYGTYIFQIESTNVWDLDPNVVFGLFTWDGSCTSCLEMANSEIDIEFAKWSDDSSRPLFYSVQPTNEGLNAERYHPVSSPFRFLSKAVKTTHIFKWTPGNVEFVSYKGYGPNFTDADIIKGSQWKFDNLDAKNGQQKDCTQFCEGSFLSKLIKVPVPTSNTKIMLNLYLFKGTPKYNMKDIEVVINKVEYTPYSNSNCYNGTFIDPRDLHSYRTVRIGSQTWMAENLAYLPSVSPSAVYSFTTPLYYVYNYQGTNVSNAKSTTNYKTYGVLYNGPAALNSCPVGWHLPSDNEWKELEVYIGMNPSDADNEGYRGTDQGTQLKSTNGWTSGGNPAGGNGTNIWCFNGLPSGVVYSYGGVFQDLTNITAYWSSSTYVENHLYGRWLVNYSFQIFRGPLYFPDSYSIRCIRN